MVEQLNELTIFYSGFISFYFLNIGIDDYHRDILSYIQIGLVCLNAMINLSLICYNSFMECRNKIRIYQFKKR